MCDEWMMSLRVPLTLEQFRQLPRHPSYRYDFLNGEAHISPHPRHYHALLPLQPLPVAMTLDIRQVEAEDFAVLLPLFSAVFQHVQPFSSLDEGTRLEAARQVLERTRTGGDGPWIEQASFVALQEGRLLGAIFVTLLPPGHPSDWKCYYWTEPPPPECIERRLGQPHLTWVFVDPQCADQGVGTALLATSVQALLALGYTHLLSTFLLGNTSSMLWHWRNGFELQAFPGSIRQFRQRIRDREAKKEESR